MSEIDITTLARDLLNFIEEEESKLQNWGYYNVKLSVNELKILIDESAPDQLREELTHFEDEGVSLDRIIDRMVRADMLVRIEPETNFRSRFAEGLRLTCDLKQRFSNDDWSNHSS